MLRKVVPFLLTAIVVGVAFFLLKAYHFSLVFYFLLSAVFLLLMCRISGQFMSGKIPSNNSKQVAVLTYLGVALMSLMVYVNYYQARGDIYSNIDHHALALKGYQMAPTDTLFGRTSGALLQDSTAMGMLTCELVRSDSDRVDSIILRASNFRRTLYVRHLDKANTTEAAARAKNVNNTLIPLQKDGDGLRFSNVQRHRTLQVQVIEKEVGATFTQSGDTAHYVFTVSDSLGQVVRRDTSAYHFFIQKSFALSTLIPTQTVSEFGNDLDGYHITRSEYLNAEGAYAEHNHPLLMRLLKDVKTFRHHQYLVEQVRPNPVATLLDDADRPHAFTIGLRPGEYFYIGFGDSGTQPMRFNERGELLFDLPKYQPLPDEQDQTEMFVTTSSAAISQPGNLSPYNVLFDVPQLDKATGRAANRHLFQSKMAFARGATQDSLLLLVVNGHKMVHAGEDFTIACNGTSQVKAIMQLTDFKGASLYQPKPFARTVLLLFIIASIMIVSALIPENPQWRGFLRIAPTAEVACVVLLMVLFTTRYILCWRLSVFPPLENISLLEYDNFIRNTTTFRYLTLLFPAAFAGCMVVKTVINIISTYITTKRVQEARNDLSAYYADYTAPRDPWYMRLGWRRAALLLPAAAVFLEMVVRLLLPRGFQILLPVAGYFLVEVMLVHIFVGRERSRHNIYRSLLYCFEFPFVFNFVLHLGLLTLFDAGFGVMFALFGAMRYYLVYTHYLSYRYYNHRWLWWIFASVGLGLLLALFFYAPNMMAFLMNHASAGNLFFIVVLSLGMMLFWWGFEEWRALGRAEKAQATATDPYADDPYAADYADSPIDEDDYYSDIPARKRLKAQWEAMWHRFGLKVSDLRIPVRHLAITLGIVGVATIMVLASGVYDKMLGPDGHYTHIRYRTKVLVEDWDKTLNNERVSDDKKITRFRQTSENQWILDHYYTHRPRLADPYFQRQPMSKTGAMWGAQSTDLSFLRFGIGEHGISYAAALLVLMLAVFALAFRQPKNPQETRREARRSIAIAALLLILTQGIFVWMSVTNKFIFFGQDFPMLSITSKMTIFYVLFLLALTIMLSWPEDATTARRFNAAERTFSLIFVAILLFFCVAVHFIVGENRKNKNVDAYLLKLDNVEKVLYAHNKLLRFYQIKGNEEYNKLILGKNQGRNVWGARLFQDFNQNIYRGSEEDTNNTIDCIILGNDKMRNSTDRRNPWVGEADALYKPFKALFDGQQGGAYYVMSPDSVTLELRVPIGDDHLGGPDASLLNEINAYFYDYQIEHRSLYMKRLSSKSTLRANNERELETNREILETGNATAFVADYLAFIDNARSDIEAQRDITLKRLIDGIDDDEVSGATFTNSLIDAYLTTYSKSNNPTNIIYLKRDHASGYLQFFINKEYFSIPKLGKPLWKGDIVSSDAVTSDLLYMHNDTPVKGDYHHNARFDVARLPASWLMGEKDQFLFRANAPTNIQLKANEQLQLPQHGWTTMRLSETDGASIPESNDNVSYTLPNDTYHVLAKNVWVNGQRRLIYTLGQSFYWMRPYSDYVAASMRDSVMLAPEAAAQNHVVSIDWELTDALYTMLDSLGGVVLRQGGQRQVPNMSVFVGNSDGEILAMSDYNANPLFRVDPNDQRRIARMRWHSNLFSDFSDDRGLNGNFNLMPLLIGPGSSLKPITFAATASTVDEDWNQFRLMGSLTTANTENYYGKTYYYVNQYAGKDFNKKNDKDRFRSLAGDEPQLGSSILPKFDVTTYLYKSSNYFNSVMVYLGSYSEASLQGGVFTDAHANFSQYGKAEFPIVRNHGRLQRFSHVFDARGADAEPILMKRYSDLFGVYSQSPSSLKEKERNTFMRDYINSNTLDPGLRATSLHAFALREKDPDKRRFMQPGEGWALPEASFIDFRMRADPTEITYSQQIKTLTLGMRRLVNISPLKMGEMFSRVFLLDRNFRFTLSGERKVSTVDFLTPAYNSVGDYLSMLQANHSFYQGLHRCALPAGNEVVDGQTMAYQRGTASYLSNVRRSGSLHFYAKTGTIDNMNLNQSNLLAVVITNGDMRRAQIRDNQLVIDGQPLKFYVVYIFMDKTLGSKFPIASSQKQPLQIGAVQRVVNSQRFRKFFAQPQQTSSTTNN
ncbi:MAG: hypothetical protein IKQ03_10500 [Prevotella sp.]|nr:hypothetical protein [Prevotella sp.]